ncbi:ComEA family DNA-binding protein [Moraxella porci]|uniref:ComEA family DNA-binding protein n=1 Tax=Moraxella porci TaxID=1288392 RepID=UPI00244765C5|nr:ComEA family DNA-binding protein [Moraxella porci]MDH2273870.1 ComEA family DNA-binding protein [Moraxella porci]
MKLNPLKPIVVCFGGLLCIGLGYAHEAKRCYANAQNAYQVLVHAQKPKILNINTASAAELTSLIGIGHTTAAAIIEYRKANGSFGSVDELLYVKGIGAATLNKNRHRLSVMSR